MFERLKTRREQISQRSILSLFDAPGRAEDFACTCDEMVLDYSKTNIGPEERTGLLDLVNQSDVMAQARSMFSGALINQTEGRAVLHTALRNLESDPVLVSGADVMSDVRLGLAGMTGFADRVRRGAYLGQGGPIADVVNIGIGGSDLGPAMTYMALAPYHNGPRCHFVSNIDGSHLADTLRGLDATTTLVIVASKTFNTIETITNAISARDWMAHYVAEPVRQFVALSSAKEKTAAFGIPPDQVFGFADWVGGRYSIWGPIGLSLMLAIGAECFIDFLRGAQRMDQHFLTAEPAQNLPVMLALVGIWHNQICGYATRAVLPYDQRLARLPAYLQQLEMESNGKGVSMDGTTLSEHSGPIVWGEPGTNGQHAFYQLLHQGTRVVPCEFILAATGHEPALNQHHRLLVANCLAQSEALMRGRTLSEARKLIAAKSLSADELDRQARHRVFVGNRPSTTLIYPKLTPEMLGRLIVLYEHRVFVEGAILGINSFDQWGVELGKELATGLESILLGEVGSAGKDGSTQRLLQYVKQHCASDLVCVHSEQKEQARE